MKETTGKVTFMQGFKLILLVLIYYSCTDISKKVEIGPIRAYDIDFDWGQGGAHGFAAPGLWADANPKDHVGWALWFYKACFRIHYASYRLLSFGSC